MYFKFEIHTPFFTYTQMAAHTNERGGSGERGRETPAAMTGEEETADLGTEVSWQGAAADADVAASKFCSWRDDLSAEAGWRGAAIRPYLAAMSFRKLHDDGGQHLLDLRKVGLRQLPVASGSKRRAWRN